ncbi:MAG: class II aldolase/adducin family protein [Oscillospiraceae bacterium]
MDMPITNQFFQEEARTEEEAKRMLVLGNRVLANEGVFDAFGHISIRNPKNPNTFFISRAISPEFVTLDDIIELNFEGKVVGGNPNFQAFGERAIHCAVYEARPDVMCVCHPHPQEILPFTATDLPLKSIFHQDVTFYDGLPVFRDLPAECGMLVNNLDIGRKLAAELGSRRGILIRNHGIVVVGESMARVLYSSITVRDSAKILLQTLATGAEVHYLSREEQENGTYQQFCKLGLPRSWNYWCTKAKKAFPDIADLEH